MAKLVKEIYDKDGCEYGFMPRLSSIVMEENGVYYTYDCIFMKSCSVSGFKEGVEDVIIADEINVWGKGIKPVNEWGNLFCELEGAENLRTITLGKNIRDFKTSSMSGFKKLEKLIIPESYTSFPHFNDCQHLKEITLPDSIAPNWDEFAWAHPLLEKVTLLRNGKEEVIQTKELEEKRLSYQKKIDAEEIAKEEEEKRKAKETRRAKRWNPIIGVYLVIVCGIPYFIAIINVFRRTLRLDMDIVNLIFELIATCFFSVCLLIACMVAIVISFYIAEFTKHKYIAAFFTPILGIPLSWILFSLVLGLLSAFNSCSDGFYGIIDPRFI